MYQTTIIVIIIITVLISMQGFNNADFKYRLAFSPYQVKHNKRYSMLFTHMFIHADWAHLIFNMFSFYFLGEILLGHLYPIEVIVPKEYQGMLYTFGPVIGNIHFVLIYILGGLFATFYPLLRNQDNQGYTSLGASGAVSAVIFAAIMWNPSMELSMLFLPIPIKAYIFGPIYLALEFWAFKRGKSNIAHDAHIGGAIFGVVYVLIINIDKGKEFFTQIFG